MRRPVCRWTPWRYKLMQFLSTISCYHKGFLTLPNLQIVFQLQISILEVEVDKCKCLTLRSLHPSAGGHWRQNWWTGILVSLPRDFSWLAKEGSVLCSDEASLEAWRLQWRMLLMHPQPLIWRRRLWTDTDRWWTRGPHLQSSVTATAIGSRFCKTWLDRNTMQTFPWIFKKQLSAQACLTELSVLVARLAGFRHGNPGRKTELPSIITVPLLVGFLFSEQSPPEDLKLSILLSVRTYAELPPSPWKDSSENVKPIGAKRSMCHKTMGCWDDVSKISLLWYPNIHTTHTQSSPPPLLQIRSGENKLPRQSWK